MNPRFPLYIVSKGRADTRLTARTLDAFGVPYHIIVEAQERDEYAAVIDPAKVLVLDPAFQRDYDPCDTLGGTRSKGSGAARNFAWAHAAAAGAEFHWTMDDNIRGFYRFHRNAKVPLDDATGFRVMEEFCLRFTNVAMAGPAYESFTLRKMRRPPFILNTRIFSCNLIRTALPHRWRGRYNEDLDLSLRLLKDGWCTVQFNAILQDKIRTRHMRGGNTTDLYGDGTYNKSRMIVDLHPDVARLAWRFNRVHHHVDYRPFAGLRLLPRPGATWSAEPDEFGLTLQPRAASWRLSMGVSHA